MGKRICSHAPEEGWIRRPPTACGRLSDPTRPAGVPFRARIQIFQRLAAPFPFRSQRSLLALTLPIIVVPNQPEAGCGGATLAGRRRERSLATPLTDETPPFRQAFVSEFCGRPP